MKTVKNYKKVFKLKLNLFINCIYIFMNIYE